MPRKKGERGYKNLSTRASEGDYQLVDPMDYMILGSLNEEGTMAFGVYPQGHTASQINEQAFQNQVPMEVLSPRFNLLRQQGLVVGTKSPGTAGKHAWQRTAAGKKVYEAWKAARDGK